MKLVAMIVMVAMAACAQPDVSTPDAGTGEVAQADTVCGLPTTCNALSCYVDGAGYVQCYENPLAGDFGCQIACGTTYARCNQSGILEYCSQVYCFNKPLGEQSQCIANCVNNSHGVCLYGLEP